MSFDSLGLRPEIVQAVTDAGYTTPTDVQMAAIPVMRDGRDVVARSQTGTGKTAAYGLPLLHAIDANVRAVQAVVLVPTRELATQVARAISRYGRGLDVHAMAIYGGQSYAYQRKRLEAGVAIAVCTPGRALDLISRGTLSLASVRTVVLDEADEMLRLGFIDDVESILSATPETRQTALFSATMPPPVRRLAEKYMRDAVEVGEEGGALTVEGVAQRYFVLEAESKMAALARLLETEAITSALIFCRTRVGCAELADVLGGRGFDAEALHGDLSQDAREMVLARFRGGRVRILVATDVAARGLDIPRVSHVFNFDFPDKPEEYVHRIGRTARAGASGTALSLVTPRETPRVAQVTFYTRRPLQRSVLPTIAEVHARRDERFSESLDTLSDELAASRAWVDAQVAGGRDLRELAAAAVFLARAQERTRPDEMVREVFPRAKRDVGRPGREKRDGGRPGREKRDVGRPGREKRDVGRSGRETRDADRSGREKRDGGRTGHRDTAGAGGERPGKRGEHNEPIGRGNRRIAAQEAGPMRPRLAREKGPRLRDAGGREVGMVSYTFDLGKTNGIKAADVVASIARQAGIPGTALGAIHVFGSRTTVDISAVFEKQVARKLRQGLIVRGQPTTLRRT